MIRDAGFSYDVIHESSLADGKALLEKHKVLVLPLNIRISKSQAKGISEFVSAGGTVITDVFPGLLNEQMSPDHNGMLADVFGVKYAGGMPNERTKMQAAADLQGNLLGEWAVDTGVSINGDSFPCRSTITTDPVFAAPVR